VGENPEASFPNSSVDETALVRRHAHTFGSLAAERLHCRVIGQAELLRNSVR